MSSKLFGARSTLLRYSGVTLAFATTPDFEAFTKLSIGDWIGVRGEVMTTAADVYSLGVLLYQLLTDDVPYRPAAAPTGLTTATVNIQLLGEVTGLSITPHKVSQRRSALAYSGSKHLLHAFCQLPVAGPGNP